MWRSERQLFWTPVTGVILFAIFANLDHSNLPFLNWLQFGILAVAFGIPVMGMGRPVEARDRKLLTIAGLVVGCIGVGIALVAIAGLTMWGVDLFVPANRIFEINPFHINFFPQDATGKSETNAFLIALFVLHVVVVAAWDAFLIGICVVPVGFAAGALIDVLKR